MSHYFINDKNLKDERHEIKVNIFNNTYKFNTDSGVFSKNKLDYGTRVLLENIDILNLKGNILDLGCGIGIIGIIISKMNKIVSIDMADINEKSVALSMLNNQINNVSNNVFASNVYENVKNKYDYIVTNPPIKAGKEVLKKFLLGSYDYLNEKGILYFVMRKDHGVKSMIKILESKFKVSIIKKDKGFYIVKCDKI